MKTKIKPIIIITLGTMILAFGMYNIHSYVGISEGGILGLTLLLQHWCNISPSITGIILNAICYIIGWKLLGKNFLIKSIFATILFSLFYHIFEQFPPLFTSLINFPLLSAIIGAIFIGTGVGLSLLYQAAPTGDDALSLTISTYIKCDIRYVYFISDITVLLLSLTYINNYSNIISSFITVIISSQIIGLITKNKK